MKVIESLEIDEKKLNKKRKLLDGISEGVELLQSGLKVIDDGVQQNHNAIELTLQKTRCEAAFTKNAASK